MIYLLSFKRNEQRTLFENLPGHGFFDILLLLLGEIVALFADLEWKESIGGTNYVKDVPENKSRLPVVGANPLTSSDLLS